MSDRIPRKKWYLSPEAGTSLTELLVAMAAGLIVLGATLQAWSHFQQQFWKQQERVVRHQDLRLALDLLEQELRVAGSGSISIAAPDELQFMANIHGLETSMTTTGTVGQATLSVGDGRGWSAGKSVLLCAFERCESLTLARDGQRFLLTLVGPLVRMVPIGASVSMVNQVRYYTRRDEQGFIRLMRMVDGGASLLVDDIQDVRFSYWDERGWLTTSLQQIARVVVDVTVRRETIHVVREMSVQT